MAEGGSSERGNAKIFDVTKVYSSLSRFEAPVEILLGHLREGRGGFYNYSTKLLACFWFFCLESSRSEKRQRNILVAQIIAWGLACRDFTPARSSEIKLFESYWICSLS
jgi:hypothetical protein